MSPKIYAESSNRKERGMYITGGVRFNADAVGAFKILQTHRRNWIVYAGSGEYNTIRGCPFAENPTDTECDESGKLIMGALLDAADRHWKMDIQCGWARFLF